MEDEQWRTIREFPNYEISNRGNIYNSHLRKYMATSRTNWGHIKVSLRTERGKRHTRSVALLVAEHFVPRPPIICDYLIMLDGDIGNISFDNLAWRPRTFAWRYTRQLKVPQPVHMYNLKVVNLDTGVKYESIYDAGVSEGLLFSDIWRATYTGDRVFPHGHTFEIYGRV